LPLLKFHPPYNDDNDDNLTHSEPVPPVTFLTLLLDRDTFHHNAQKLC